MCVKESEDLERERRGGRNDRWLICHLTIIPLPEEEDGDLAGFPRTFGLTVQFTEETERGRRER